MEVLVILTVLAAGFAMGGAVLDVNAATEARRHRQALDRERHHLNRTHVYQHPRSIR